jgi:hypothetical protein
MPRFVFQIRPLSLEEGVELLGECVLPHPMRYRRLHDAVIYSFHVGRNLDAEIRILDCDGKVADLIPINPPGFVAWELQERSAA